MNYSTTQSRTTRYRATLPEYFIESIFSRYAPNLGKTAHNKLTLKMPFKQNIEISLDTQLFKHVLNNLISNASRYSENDTLVTLSQDHEFIFITVEDDGSRNIE